MYRRSTKPHARISTFALRAGTPNSRRQTSASASFANLATAENTAASCLATGTKAVAISNSYGSSEAGSTSFNAAYTHAGIGITASSSRTASHALVRGS